MNQQAMEQPHALDWPELLTGEQVAEFLNIPYDEKHIRRLRSREKLPHLCFDVAGEKHFRYPTSRVRAWVDVRVRIGNKRVDKNPGPDLR